MEKELFRERLQSTVRQYDFVLYLVLVFEILLFLFAILAYLFAELNAETRSILVLDFVLLGVLLIVTAGLIRFSHRKHPQSTTD